MAVKRRGGLGKGLDSLIRDKSSLSDSSKNKNSSAKSPKSSKSQTDLKKDSDKNQKPKNELNTEENIQNNNNIGKNIGKNGNDNSITKLETTIYETENEFSTDNILTTDSETLTTESKTENENIFAGSPINTTSETGEMYASAPNIEEPEAAISSENGNGDSKAVKTEKINEKDKGDSVLILKISSVEPNRDQPRKHFSEEGIEELASSIKQYGIIQPLLVQKRDDYYEIIAGERRWRAAMKAGLKEVPVIVKDYTNREAVEISLIENIQREDLNPIEEALAYDRLIQEFEMTQEQVAGRVSKSRSAVTNSLRLLKLDAEVRQMVIAGEISEGHARTLLGLPNEEMQKLLADRIIKEKLSVRDTEKLVKKLTTNTPKKQKTRDYQKEAILENLSEQLKVILGTKVSITEKGKSKGKIEIEYYSDEELNRLFEILQSVRKIEY